MTHCPYPEIIQDEDSGIEVCNDQYKYWHEGYEAHKFEIANLSIKISYLAQRLDTEVRNVQELKRKLLKQMSKLQEAD